uniref:DUF883 family protein n=1 Tax=Marinobacterium profundum TaxID=1714300 RepID=UPI000830EF6E|nr:DUF883 family protein [Marinobacterium profundum]
MNKPNSVDSEASVQEGATLSRRVADDLHERIEQAAKVGEELEHGLHERGEQLTDKSRDLNTSLTQIVRDNPWAVVGGSVALGILIGVLTRRR